MRIIISTVEEKEILLHGITELTFGDAADAACAYISVCFTSDKSIGEIVSVKAYDGSTLVFNGFCDCQRKSIGRSGIEYYVYARSSASLLLDNEAKPFTYMNVTTSTLFELYARELGFTNKLPKISCEALYEVQKGSSCFGAINQFTTLISGKRIYVTPNNEITVLEEKETISFNSLDLISAVETINRSEPLSSVIYKRDSLENDYTVNAHAGLSDSLMLKRVKYINLGTIPPLQRDYTVLNQLKQSYEKYKVLELTVNGYAKSALFTKLQYPQGNTVDEYILYEKKYMSDKNAEKTKLFFRKNIDIKEITYVDKQTG